MGAFCVFGISRGVCRALATRRQSTEVSDDGAPRRQLSMAEWAERRDALAQRLFEQASKPVKVSPEFDAPQFCADWLAAGANQVRDPVVMVRGGKVDKNGRPLMRKGVQLVGWVRYEGN